MMNTTSDRCETEENMCPQCGRETLTDRHCKVVCEQCGYTESCEDIFQKS